jgi:serine O-acetyltransferase
MSRPRLFAQIAEDWRAHGRDWTRPGFRAVATHRFGVWRMGVRPKLLRAPFSILYRMLFRHCRNIYGIELPWSVTLGRHVVFEHQGGIVIHGACVIGDHCIIRQGCTLGLRRIGEADCAPILEDGVELGAGAVLLGRVRIGKGAQIGANAVVTRDVPPHALAIGVPAHIVKRGEQLPDPGTIGAR